MQIFVHHDGQKLGPHSVEETQALLDSGEILASDLAWHEGLDTWIALSSLPAMGGSGAPPQPPAVYQHQHTYQAGPISNGLAIASLVLGISSIVVALTCCAGFLTAIPGAVCGHLALGQITRSKDTQTGRGLAIAGLWISYIMIVLNVLLPIGILLFAGGMNGLETLLDEIQ